MKTYNKLVRDRIPEIIEKNKDKCKFHIATNEEYEEKLYEKLQEELVEFIGNPSAEELADMLEVLDAIRNYHNIDIFDLKNIKINKRKERGGFNGRIILETTN